MRSTPIPSLSATLRAAKSSVRAVFRDVDGCVMMFSDVTPP